MEEHATLGMHIPEFHNCIGFIDGIFNEIHKPLNNDAHISWFDGRKKMYCMNNTFVIDHCGLFIYLNSEYPSSMHDVTILCEYDLYKNCCECFMHTNDYFKYLLGDLGYMFEETWEP